MYFGLSKMTTSSPSAQPDTKSASPKPPAASPPVSQRRVPARLLSLCDSPAVTCSHHAGFVEMAQTLWRYLLVACYVGRLPQMSAAARSHAVQL